MKGNSDLEIKEGFTNQGYLTSNPVSYDPTKAPLRTEPKAMTAQLDPNHSHFILVSVLAQKLMAVCSL